MLLLLLICVCNCELGPTKCPKCPKSPEYTELEISEKSDDGCIEPKDDACASDDIMSEEPIELLRACDEISKAEDVSMWEEGSRYTS